MKNLETKIIIEADKERVWQILMDNTAYPEWNPFISSLEGELRAGQQIHVAIQPPGQKAMQFQPLVLVCKRNQEFRWKGKLFIKGLFDGEHYFILKSIGDNKTQLIHGERFSGLLTPVLLKMIGESTLAGFEAMNEALKARAEGGN